MSAAAELLVLIERLVDERVEEKLAAALDALRTESHAGPRWLTYEQAGERMGCTADAVRMRANRGRLTCRRIGRSVYVSAEDVDGIT
jgi:excisionase family DNA binding protein